MPRPTVSVIICCYSFERYDDIREAVASVLNQTLPAHEVIVAVDHNPALLERLRADLPPSVTLIPNDGVKGLSANRNAGIAVASGAIVAFMDDDAVAQPDWLRVLAGAFVDPAVLAAGGRIVPRWTGGARPAWFPEELNWIVGCTYKGMPVQNKRVRNVIGCNMAFRITELRAIGGFHPDVGRVGKMSGIGEDSEVCLRLTRTYPEALILHETGAVVDHKVPAWRASPGYVVRRSHDEGRYKTVVRALSAARPGEALATENSYLRYLLLQAVPRRLTLMSQPARTQQAATILLCIAATATGYLRGRLRQRIAGRPTIHLPGQSSA